MIAAGGWGERSRWLEEGVAGARVEAHQDASGGFVNLRRIHGVLIDRMKIAQRTIERARGVNGRAAIGFVEQFDGGKAGRVSLQDSEAIACALLDGRAITGDERVPNIVETIVDISPGAADESFRLADRRL